MAKGEKDPVKPERATPRVLRIAPCQWIVERPAEVKRERDRRRRSRQNRRDGSTALARLELPPARYDGGGNRKHQQNTFRPCECRDGGGRRARNPVTPQDEDADQRERKQNQALRI